jgi:DNA-binding NarL/FixJ family response regulator
MKILLAEDQTLLREATRRLLESEPDVEIVGEAGDGQEAIDLALQLDPDVVLLDMAMPRLNGVEVIRQIKERRPRVAVLVLSAYDYDAYVVAALEAGAAGYILKDVSADELVAALRTAAEGEPTLHPAVTRKLLRRLTHRMDAGMLPESLTERESDVLKAAATGVSNKEIAARLELSPRTVQIHMAKVFSKLNVATRTEAVVKGLKLGLLTPDDLP